MESTVDFTTGIYQDEVYESHEMNKDDAKLVVFFYHEPVKLEAESKEAGRPIFKDVEYIKIIVPGQRDIMVTEVTEDYIRRFYDRYKSWRNKIADPESGTPLKEVAWLSKSQIEEFKWMNIKTLEQLANISDATAQKFVGIADIRRRAQAFIEAAKGNAPLLVMESKLKERDEQIADLQDKVNSLLAAKEQTESAQKPKMVPVKA